MRISAIVTDGWRRLDRTWLVIYASAFFALSLEGVVGLLVPMLLLELQAPDAVLGLLVSLAALGPLLLSLPAGALCDRFGDRRVLLACAFGSLITSVLYPLVSVLWLIGVLQLVGGSTRSVGWLASQSYIARAVGEGNRNRAQHMGLFTFSANLGMLLAPPLVGAVVSLVNARAGFVVLALWSLALVVVAGRLPEPSRRPRQRPAGSILRAAYGPFLHGFRMALRPAVAVILAATFLRLATIAASQSFYPVYLARLGYSPATIGVLFSVMFLASTLAAPITGLLARYISTDRLLWLATLLSICGIMLVTQFETLAPIAVLTVLHGIGIGLSLPTLLAEVGAATAPEERGLALALRTVFNRLGYMIVPTSLGFLVARYDIYTAFAIAGAAMLGIMALAMAFQYLVARGGLT